MEKINGIVWDNDENNMEFADRTRHYRFNDTSKVIVEGWNRNDYEDSECFEYSVEGPFTILESSSNKLVLADSYEEGEVLYEDFVTLALEENGLKIVRFDDFNDDFGTMIWEKSTIEINTLKMCN